MKNILKYMKAVLACLFVSLAFVACSDDDDLGSADLGLGIKVFAPTHVVAGQPMTINGSGFDELAEIEFPGGVKVSTFELVTNEMIRLKAPAGMPAEGGKVILHGKDGKSVESRQSITIGKTIVSGYSLQPGEKIKGLEELTIYGEDLLFVNEIILLDENEEPLTVPQTDFSRLAPNRLILKVPNNIFTGVFAGTIKTFDGQSFTMPEYEYEPTQQGGHWETQKKVLWENDGSLGEISWSGDYRFSNVDHITGEQCYAFPLEDWDIIKNGEFKVDIEGANPQIRVTTGWWSTTWTGNDIQPGNSLLVDNGNGSWTLTVTFVGDPILEVLDDQHLLFTGGGYTVKSIYTEEEVWIGGGEGHWERASLWKNEGNLGEISWSGDYRFSNVDHITGEQCYAFPLEDWDIIKNGEFKVDIEGANPQVRITTGWWSTTWTGNDIQPGNELLVDNGDGTWTITVKFAGDPILDVLDDQHLLFTGGGYKVKEIYTEVWVEGGDAVEKELNINVDCVRQDDRSVAWTFPSLMTWDDTGRFRVMRDGASSLKDFKFKADETVMRFYKTGTGQIQVNNPNWQSFTSVSDWEGSLDVLELVLTQDIIDCFTGVTGDGWSETALILQGDGLTVSKITIE